MKATHFFQMKDIYLAIINNIDNWGDLENFASVNTTSWQTCTSLSIDLPLYTSLSLNEVHSFQLKTTSSLFITDDPTIDSIMFLKRSLSFFLRLKKLSISPVLNTPQVSSIVTYLINFHPRIILLVPSSNYLVYHHKLNLKKNEITLQKIDAVDMKSDDNKSDEELISPRYEDKNIDKDDDNSDFYLTPEFVKVRVMEYKQLLKLPFIQSDSLPRKSSLTTENKNKLPSSLFDLLISHSSDTWYQQLNDKFDYESLWKSEKELIEVINSYAIKMMRCIFLGTKKWIIITQFDVFYMNNMQYDDCAQTFNGNFPLAPSPRIITKNEYNNSWNEIILQWGPLQFLALGGYIGNISNKIITSFLGSAIKNDIELENDIYNVLTSFFEIPFKSGPRYLRDYSKKHSHLPWSFVSTIDVARQFIACHPLHIDSHPTRKNCKPNICTLYSIILRHLCYLHISKKDLLTTQIILLDMPSFMGNINTDNLPTTPSTFFNDIFDMINDTNNKKLSQFIRPLNIIKIWEASLHESISDEIIIIPTNDLKREALQLYKDTVYRNIKAANDKLLKDNTYIH